MRSKTIKQLVQSILKYGSILIFGLLVFLVVWKANLKIVSDYSTYMFWAVFATIQILSIFFHWEARARIIVNLLDRKEFIARVKKTAGDVGYELQSESESILAFEPVGQEGMTEKAVIVRLGEQTAEITGPIWLTRKLHKRMEFLFENVLLPS